MDVIFKDDKIGDACNFLENGKLDDYIKKAHAPQTSEYILTVLEELRAYPNIATLPSYYHYELLKYKNSGLASITLKTPNMGGRGKWRMILRPISHTNDINNKNSIEQVIIEELISDHYS